MTQTIEQLTARVRELEEENARLRFALADTEALELGTSERLATLTRQRDLAVEALEVAERGFGLYGNEPLQKQMRKALSAIKGSEK